MPSLSLSFSASTIVLALLVLLSAALSIYFYRRTLPPVAPAKKVLLIALRSLALSLLLAMLFEPLLSLISTSTEKPVLAVLVDNSKSMSIADKTGDRAEQMKGVLKSNGLKNVEAFGALRYFTFGARPTEHAALNADSLSLNEDATDMAAALRAIAEQKEVSNIGAVLLAGDGSYNLGQNPIYEAEQLGIPIFSVGIGDSTEQRDLLITKVLANELVHAQTEVPVDVTVKSSGYNGEKVDVVLSDGAKELQRTRIVLEEGTREYSAHLSSVPEGEGMKKYSVRVSRLQGELTTANNQRTFYTRILKSKMRVLIIAGSPSPDLTIVKQTLSEDKNIEVRSLTQKSSGDFYEGRLTDRILDSADCLALIGFPISSTSEQVLHALRTTGRSLPILFVNGKSIDERKLGALGSFLPFVASHASQTEQLVFIEPSPNTHPVLATNTGVQSWRRLPPLFKLQTQYQAKPEASVVAFININPASGGIAINEPLIVLRNVNRQKSLAILGYGIWRWRLMAQGNPETERLLATFLSNSIRWLTTRDDNRPVKVATTKSAFTRGEPVEFTAQVYDANANPVENAQVNIVAEHATGEIETALRPIGNGRYEATLDGLSEGDYTFRARAEVEGQSLGEDKGRFSVGELNLEFQDTRMNAQLLRQLAAATGGRFFAPSEISELAEILRRQGSFAQREIRRAQSFELWNWKYMLALVVVLLAVEWLVRKRSGML